MPINDRWQIGDVVRLVSLDGESNPDLSIGMMGRVFVNDGRWRKDAVGIDWFDVPTGGYCHSFNGELESNTGYYVLESQIERVDDDFEAADDASFDDLLEV